MSDAAAVRAFYLCYFGALGLLHPLFPLFLTDHGVSPDLAIRILALFPLASVLVPPVAGLVADLLRARAWILRGTTLLCAIAIAALTTVAEGVTGVVAATIAYAVLRAPLTALIDAAACRTAERIGSTYGQLRVWGSIGFLLSVLAGGALAEESGWSAVMRLAAVAYGCAVVASFFLQAPPHERRPRVLPAWIELLSRREVWWFLITIVLSQIGYAVYDACYSLHLRRSGHGESFIALAWGIGVVAEITMLAFSRRLLARFHPAWLLVSAFAVTAVRWLLVAHVSAPEVLLPLQLLHGITFPLFWMPAVILVQGYAPRALSTSAQGLLAAAAGLGGFVGMSLGAPLLQTLGTDQLFVHSAGLSACAALGALLLPRARAAA